MDKRPTLNDPAEWEIVRSMYFKDNRPIHHDVEPDERLERNESKQRNKKKSSR